MNIHLYQKDYASVFLKCSGLLQRLNYFIRYEDINHGIISAFKNESQTRIIDLKFSYDDSDVRITVLPGLLSYDYENINYDERSANEFAEKLFSSFKPFSESNAFRLMQEDYLAAITI